MEEVHITKKHSLNNDYKFKKGMKMVDFLGEEKNALRIKKCVDSRKKTFKEERARVAFGLPQKTKMKVIVQADYIKFQRSYLRRLGYIIDKGSMIAYYTPNTRRSAVYESRTKENHKRYVAFQFKPIEQK